MTAMTHETLFDEYSEDYDTALAHGLAVTGQNKEFFARGRVSWLADCLKKLHFQPKSVIDFGCGIGTATPYFLELIPVDSVLGVDVSLKCIEVARKTWSSSQACFTLLDNYQPRAEFDLAFCNGTFHRALRPGGVFALWENNPWNPGTRYVMSRLPFDRDAVTLTAPEARRMLRAGGFEIVSTHYQFIFPRVLGWLSGIEPLLSALPLGAQYQILCRKPPV
jgi:SAM-dependent methyltransferase